jgi:hypothetical protein
MAGDAAKRIAKLADVIDRMTPEDREELEISVQREFPAWVALPGPQTEAFNSEGDILFYGGSAGGGKSDLLLGLALTRHRNSIIFRREAVQLIGLQKRLLDEIMRTRKGWNGQDDILTLPDRCVEFGSCKDAGSEIKYQGRPHDLVGFDEITHFLEAQFRFLMGWNRTTITGQRCRVVCTGNPPTDADGAWVIQFWGPWLDEKHHHPAMPGELRWYAMVDGQEVEVSSSNPFAHHGKRIQPLSRTFIPSRVVDNPFLMATGYEATLQALPEPLRSQMLEGDFRAGREDNIWQAIPTAWIEAAMARWRADGKTGRFMDSAGVDVARGGRDKTIIATRYGNWYAPLHAYPGSETPDGPVTAGIVVSVVRDGSPIHVDVIGVGGAVYDWLKSNGLQVIGVNGAEKAGEGEFDKASGKLKFRNMRALLWWRFRESLDPKMGDNIALPPDSELKADLCTPLWKLTPQGIQIESKEDIVKRLQRSPDKGDAVVYCAINTIKTHPSYNKNWRDKMTRGTWRSGMGR